MTRRDFLKDAVAALGFAALPGGRLFAAPEGWKHGGEPNLVLGVVSDTHLRTGVKSESLGANWPDRYFVAALKHFRRQNVDAVVHCGDMAHRGQTRELEVENVANVEILPNANIQSQLETGNIGIGNTGNIGNIVIKIPLADGNPDSRVYAYEVVVAGEDGAPKLHIAVYAAGCNMGIGHEPNGGVTTLDIPYSEISSLIPHPSSQITVAVRPLTSLGTYGRPISVEVHT